MVYVEDMLWNNMVPAQVVMQTCNNTGDRGLQVMLINEI